MIKIDLIREQHQTGIFNKGNYPKLFSFLAVTFFIISLFFYTFFYWKLDYAREEAKRLSKQNEALEIANKKIIAIREADIRMKIDTFTKQVSAQEATGAVATARKVFSLFPKEGVQVDRFSFSAKEIIITGIASNLEVIMSYIKTLKNNVAYSRNWKLVSAKQREIKGVKFHEFVVRCDR